MNIRSHLAEDRHAHFERMQCIFLARFWLGQLIGLYLFSRSSCCCYGMVIVFPHWTNDTRFLGRYVESIPRAKEIMHEWEPRKRRKHGKIRKKRVHIDMSDHWLCCMMSGISCHNQSQCDPMKKKGNSRTIELKSICKSAFSPLSSYRVLWGAHRSFSCPVAFFFDSTRVVFFIVKPINII